MKKWGLLLILLLSLLPRTAFAAETADAICIEGETEGLDTDAVDAAAEEMDAAVSFSDLLAEILSGEFDFTFANIREKASELMFGELRMQGRLLAQLVLIVILSAILKQCSDSFQGKNVGEMGFYVCYMVLIVAILTSFYSISQSVVERMRGLCGVFGAMVPIFLVLSASSGNLAQGALMGPTLMGGATALSVGISYVLIPAIQLSIALEMADHISEKPILGKFAELLRQCISWGMKGAAMLFMLLLSLQKIGGGALNGLAAKTAKIAVGAVPVVGGVMGGAVETAAAMAGTLKSGTLVAAVVLLLLLCLPLLIKLLVILLVFRLTAAAAEFICEERLVECIAAAGEYIGLLLGIVFLLKGQFPNMWAVLRARHAFHLLRPSFADARKENLKKTSLPMIPERVKSSILVGFYLRGKKFFSQL